MVQKLLVFVGDTFPSHVFNFSSSLGKCVGIVMSHITEATKLALIISLTLHFNIYPFPLPLLTDYAVAEAGENRERERIHHSSYLLFV